MSRLITIDEQRRTAGDPTTIPPGDTCFWPGIGHQCRHRSYGSCHAFHCSTEIREGHPVHTIRSEKCPACREMKKAS